MGALGRPYHGYYVRIWQKGAALLHGVSTSHGFIDGNKRTAWLLTDLLFTASGYLLNTREGDRIDDLMVDVVNRNISQITLVKWLSDRTVGPHYF
jgi:death on curing protein